MMRRKLQLCVVTTVLAFLTLGQSQCPNEPPPPPFDATGTYAGEWWGNTENEDQEIVACPLTITLQQDVTANYPADHGVQGTVVVNYSCIELPDWVDEIPDSEINVTGLLENHGKLSLFSGGCGTGICAGVVLSGFGEDTDGDGMMDAYSGDWSFTILLAGVNPFGVTGGFDLATSE